MKVPSSLSTATFYTKNNKRERWQSTIKQNYTTREKKRAKWPDGAKTQPGKHYTPITTVSWRILRATILIQRDKIDLFKQSIKLKSWLGNYVRSNYQWNSGRFFHEWACG